MVSWSEKEEEGARTSQLGSIHYMRYVIKQIHKKTRGWAASIETGGGVGTER